MDRKKATHKRRGGTTAKHSHKTTSSSRNPFIQFLNHYRKLKNCNIPAWLSASHAAELWAHMSSNDKYCYVEAAQKSNYKFSSRDRRLNRVLQHMRGAMQSDQRIDLVQLATAVKQVQIWKRSVLESMCVD